MNKVSEARSLMAYFSRKELGVTGAELAKYFGITEPSISAAIKRGQRIANEKEYLII